MRKLLPVFFLLFCISLFAQYDAKRYPVIPRPVQLLPFTGEFQVSEKTVILTDNKFYRKEIEQFRREVKKQFGIELKYAAKASADENAIYISEDSLDIPHEGYYLFVNRSEINLYGGHAGIFYGLQTLLQLMHRIEMLSDVDRSPRCIVVASCSILDQPRFPWRGMHLDVSRHFFPKENIREYLRWMAMYKLNTFHWHLTDDQGWRIEIKKYPKLTQVGAWRNGTLTGHYGEKAPRYDTIHYGGFYTQDDIREIVKYADSLHITIVPEIEMPGHASAMLAAYPELGCTTGPFAVQKTWGIFDDVLCPREETFAFLDDVLKEVCALFPGKYIHIGGDECPKAQWKASPFCQNLMAKNNLKTEEELQSWFTKRVVELLKKRGKETIGWDEILEGGLAEGAAVMSWRGEDGGIAAAKAKHNVVMSPGGFCYFDHYQSQSPDEPLAIGGYLPLEKVYRYDPVPASLSKDEKNFILGVQANLWTEYIGDWKQVQYMVFPRICALSEVAWSIPENKNEEFFVKRLQAHLNVLNKMGIHYARSLFEVKATYHPAPDGLQVSLSTLASEGNLYYFLDSNTGIRYEKPFVVHGGDSLKAWLLDENNTMVEGPVYRKHFEKNNALGKTVTLRKPPSPSYNTGGALMLVDGITGRRPWIGSEWLGFWGDTLDATIDLGKDTLIRSVFISPLQDQSSWIYYPDTIRILLSDDGVHFREGPVDFSLTNHLNFESPFPAVTFLSKATRARYVRVIASSLPQIPENNPGAGNPAWLFIDEIIIQ